MIQKPFVLQVKMARVALGFGVRDLAAHAGVSQDTISRLERGEDLKPVTLDIIRATLEAFGIEFIQEADSGSVGVVLRKTKKVRTKR